MNCGDLLFAELDKRWVVNELAISPYKNSNMANPIDSVAGIFMLLYNFNPLFGQVYSKPNFNCQAKKPMIITQSIRKNYLS